MKDLISIVKPDDPRYTKWTEAPLKRLEGEVFTAVVILGGTHYDE